MHCEYATIQAYQLTDFKKSRNACVVAVSVDLCAQLICVRGHPVAAVQMYLSFLRLYILQSFS